MLRFLLALVAFLVLGVSAQAQDVRVQVQQQGLLDRLLGRRQAVQVQVRQPQRVVVQQVRVQPIRVQRVQVVQQVRQVRVQPVVVQRVRVQRIQQDYVAPVRVQRVEVVDDYVAPQRVQRFQVCPVTGRLITGY